MAVKLSVEQKIKDAVKEVRGEMGNSVKSITEYCQKKKIKGYVGDPQACPLAIAFSRAVRKKAKNVEISVDGDDIIVRKEDDEGWKDIATVPCRKVEQNFVVKFDDEKIPELDANPPEPEYEENF